MNGGFKPTFIFFINLFLSVLRKAQFPCRRIYMFIIIIITFRFFFATRKNDKIKTLIIEQRAYTHECVYNTRIGHIHSGAREGKNS